MTDLEALLSRMQAHMDRSEALRGKLEAPSVLYRPALSIHGRRWCAAYGRDHAVRVVGFGWTPAEAMADFDKQWISMKAADAAYLNELLRDGADG